MFLVCYLFICLPRGLDATQGRFLCGDEPDMGAMFDVIGGDMGLKLGDISSLDDHKKAYLSTFRKKKTFLIIEKLIHTIYHK